MKTLTANQLKKIRAKYEENEYYNAHSENVVLLAENFGTDFEIEVSKLILKHHLQNGHLTLDLSNIRYVLSETLYGRFTKQLENNNLLNVTF